MKNEFSSQEIKGRLMLWEAAVRQTQNLLALAKRTKLAIEHGDLKDRDDEYFRLLHNFSIKQSDYVEDQLNSNHINLFNETYEAPFPTTSELFPIYDSLIEMAIIYFCQILNKGYGKSDVAASNCDSANNIHLIADCIFTNPDEVIKFKNFCNSLLTARDKMLAHADANFFDIQHGVNVSSMTMYCRSWEKIDFDYWKKFLEKFRIAILEVI